MDYSLELLLKYPLITSNTQGNLITHKGTLCCNSRDYFVTINQKNCDKKPLFSITLEPESHLIRDIDGVLENNEFNNVVEVLDYIKSLIESKSMTKTLENHSVTYVTVLHEYSEFTKFFLNLKTCKISPDLTKIYVSTTDEKNREHSIEISVNYGAKTKNIFEITKFDLPQRDSTLTLFKPNCSLTELFDQFLGMVERFQPYFDLMETFDNACCILDPENPNRADLYRRILLGDNTSMIVTVDPDNVNLRPDIKFLGPERSVEKFRTQLNNNLENWDIQNDVFQGLLDLLGIQNFPQKTIQEKRTDVLMEYGECSICFSLRLNEKLPEIICKNESCEKFYHMACLYEWLTSINSRRVFSELCGKCPNCEKTITCPIPIL